MTRPAREKSLVERQGEALMGIGLQKTVTVMLFELGDIAKCVFYGLLDQREDRVDRVYEKEARVALADLVTQCRIAADLLGIDFAEAIRTGEERFLERLENYEVGNDGPQPNAERWA